MDQHLRPAFEEHLNLGSIFDSGGDAQAEAWMLHDVTWGVPVLGGIALGFRHILSPQKRLVAARTRLRRLRSRRAWFALARCSRNSAWLVRLVAVLRVARVALHARRLVADHGFDRVRQDHFALAAPTVNGAARLLVAVCSFHNTHGPIE